MKYRFKKKAGHNYRLRGMNGRFRKILSKKTFL